MAQNGDKNPTDEPPLHREPDESQRGDIHELHDAVMREHERPRDGFEPLSVTLVMLFFALIGWGGWYLGAYSGAFHPDVIDIIPLAEQGVPTEVVDPEPVEVDPMELGENVYSDCAACHQADGTGLEGSFPPLVGTDRVLGDAGPLAAIIIDGLEGPIVVDGVDYDDLMPGWDTYTDQEIAAVLTYIRQSWGNDADPVDEALVADVRQLTEERVDPWTDPELEEFFADIDDEDLGAPDEEEPDEEGPDEEEPDEEEPGDDLPAEDDDEDSPPADEE